MVIKARLPLFLFLCSLFLASLSFSAGDENVDLEELNPGSPRREFQQCQERCQQEGRQRGQGQQQQQCERRCEEQLRERERQREREDVDDFSRDPRRQYEQCEQICERQDPRQKQQCRRRCQRQYEEQQERGRGGRGRDSEDSIDPHRQYQQCQQRCERQEQGQRQQQVCQRRCEEQREREERERQRGRDSEDSSRDPQRQYQQCQQRCERQEQGQRQQQQCQRSCEEQREREERERQRGRDSEDSRDPQRQYQQCRERCQRQEQGQRQQQQCQRSCEEQREREERERRHGRDNEDSSDILQCKKQYQQCQESCERQEQGQRQQCQRRCEEQREREERERRHGRDSEESRDPQRQYEQCQRQCQRQQRGQQQQLCRRRCEQQREQEERQEQGREWGRDENPQRGREDERQRNNPYYFHSQRFQSRFRSQEGHIRSLERFSERSEFLRGIENYRLVILEANPNTFILPHHCDAESVLVVVRGKTTINFVLQDKKQSKRESYNLERGDVIMIPAGTTVYALNQDSNEKLEIVKLVQSVNSPGQYREFHAAGSQNSDSYFRAFSHDILEPALNTPRDQLEKFFEKQEQREGVIIRASQEQLRTLSQHAMSAGHKGHSSRGPISLQNQRPLYSNQFGKYVEACPEEHKQLKDMDVYVSCAEINQGAMMVPYYNSIATTVIYVVEGTGRIEMACPHLSSQSQSQSQSQEYRRGREEEEEEESSGQFQRVTARLSPGDAFVIPAGHPVSIVASQNENLRLVGFGINAQNNQKNFLAGKENIINQIERQAMELSFNMQGEEIERIFGNQKESVFVPRDRQSQRGQGRDHPLASILNLAAFF